MKEKEEVLEEGDEAHGNQDLVGAVQVMASGSRFLVRDTDLSRLLARIHMGLFYNFITFTRI